MANWKTTVDIEDLHDRFGNEEISIQQLAAGVVEKLKQNEFADEFEMLDIIDEFESIAENPDATVNDYDYVLAELYNFADREHRIWVKTF